MYVVTKRLTQWGSKELGDKGLTPIEILRYFYGEEPVTQGKKYEEALAMAADWLLSVATIAKEKQDEL